MARRHVIQYFLEQEHAYLEMQEMTKELQKLAEEGKVEESVYLDYKKEADIVLENYLRIAHIVKELNRPNRKTKDEDDFTKSWYDVLKSSSREAILDESKDALAHIREIVRSLQDGQH